MLTYTFTYRVLYKSCSNFATIAQFLAQRASLFVVASRKGFDDDALAAQSFIRYHLAVQYYDYYDDDTVDEVLNYAANIHLIWAHSIAQT